MSALLSVTAITDDPDRFVARHGTVTATFGRTQDFGNVSCFCGPAALAEVVQQATRPSRDDRPATVAAFADAWQARLDPAGLVPPT